MVLSLDEARLLSAYVTDLVVCILEEATEDMSAEEITLQNFFLSDQEQDLLKLEDKLASTGKCGCILSTRTISALVLLDKKYRQPGRIIPIKGDDSSYITSLLGRLHYAERRAMHE